MKRHAFLFIAITLGLVFAYRYFPLTQSVTLKVDISELAGVTELEGRNANLRVTWRYLGDHRLGLQFLVIPHSKLELNFDKNAPWRLLLTDVKGLTFKTQVFDKSHIDRELGGFVFEGVQAPNDKESIHVRFDLMSFVCTSDKKNCYFEKFKGYLPQ